MRPRKIYLASSWKNAKFLKELAAMLRQSGHQVFLFCDPETRPDSLPTFCFDARIFAEIERTEIHWATFPALDPAKKAFASDKAGLDWADTVVLVLPSGRSSHLEAGYAAGQGKSLFIFGELPEGEFDVMYGFAQYLFTGDDLIEMINTLGKDSPFIYEDEAVYLDENRGRSDGK